MTFIYDMRPLTDQDIPKVQELFRSTALMFVHENWQRRGVATRLLSKVGKIHTKVSITTRSFF